MRNKLMVAVCLPAFFLRAQEPPPELKGGSATFGTTVVIPGGLRGEIYNLPVGTFKLPNFEKMKPVGAIYTSDLFVPARDFMEGFPGVTDRNEWFAIDYKGKFWVDKPDSYRFFLTSDDGSRLYIDDKLVIDNDGVHGPDTVYGGVKLGFGIHSIRVSFFQGPRYALALVLGVSRPGGAWRLFNTNEFKPPPNPDDWDGLAALKADPLPNDFEFRVGTLQFRNQASGWQGAVVLDLPAQTGRGPVSLLAIVKDSHDKIVAVGRVTPPAEAQGQPFTYSQPLTLPERGQYKVEAVAVDRQTKRASVRQVALDVSPPESGIDLSSVLLARLAEPAKSSANDPLVYQERHVVPLLASQLDPSQNPAVYFVVYPDTGNAQPPKIRVEFLVDGHSLASQSMELPRPGASGDIPIMVGAAAVPGNCELRITAVQGDGVVARSVKYSVAGK